MHRRHSLRIPLLAWGLIAVLGGTYSANTLSQLPEIRAAWTAAKNEPGSASATSTVNITPATTPRKVEPKPVPKKQEPSLPTIRPDFSSTIGNWRESDVSGQRSARRRSPLIPVSESHPTNAASRFGIKVIPTWEDAEQPAIRPSSAEQIPLPPIENEPIPQEASNNSDELQRFEESTVIDIVVHPPEEEPGRAHYEFQDSDPVAIEAGPVALEEMLSNVSNRATIHVSEPPLSSIWHCVAQSNPVRTHVLEPEPNYVEELFEEQVAPIRMTKVVKPIAPYVLSASPDEVSPFLVQQDLEEQDYYTPMLTFAADDALATEPEPSAVPKIELSDQRLKKLAAAHVMLNKPISSVSLAFPSEERSPENLAAIVRPKLEPNQLFGESWPSPMLSRYPERFLHRPLYFEDPNLERCGRHHGAAQTFCSGTRFLGASLLFPVRLVLQPPCKLVCTRGDCRTCEMFEPICPGPRAFRAE